MELRKLPFLAVLFAYSVCSFSQDFSDKVVHSFGVQYNNCFYPKWEATFKHEDGPNTGWDPLTSWGYDILLKYNITFPVGLGATLEGVWGNRAFELYDRQNRLNTAASDFAYERPYLYLGFNFKISYSKEITSWLDIQPDLGLKLVAHQKTGCYAFIINDYGRQFAYMEFDNFDVGRFLVPDLTTGITFLLHHKKYPRHNFIVGLNANFSFVKRFEGYYSVAPPDWERRDCEISYNGSYFGINVGYEFVGFSKKRKAK
ncbi:MAG: hypothetical protein LBQ31_00860 [Bacteroidales bacterium]|jgi:hypothetical protein|nr:hypothetical protein [Bacteroidales bacterium]